MTLFKFYDKLADQIKMFSILQNSVAVSTNMKETNTI